MTEEYIGKIIIRRNHDILPVGHETLPDVRVHARRVVRLVQVGQVNVRVLVVDLNLLGGGGTVREGIVRAVLGHKNDRRIGDRFGSCHPENK